MNNEIIKMWTGGARLDCFNATWPFAKLKITNEELILKIVISKTIRFKKAEIKYLEIYKGSLPLFGRAANGIGIFHNKSKTEYPDIVIFWYFGDVERLAHELVQQGFGERAYIAKYPYMI
jgi:hypothetical protein